MIRLWEVELNQENNLRKFLGLLKASKTKLSSFSFGCPFTGPKHDISIFEQVSQLPFLQSDKIEVGNWQTLFEVNTLKNLAIKIGPGHLTPKELSEQDLVLFSILLALANPVEETLLDLRAVKFESNHQTLVTDTLLDFSKTRNLTLMATGPGPWLDLADVKLTIGDYEIGQENLKKKIA